MNILLVRVDDRFIHGQILEAWIPFLNAQSVVVANDTLAGDDFQKTIMSMAIPDRIHLRIVPIERVLTLQDDKELDGKRTLVIVSSIKDAYRLRTTGLEFSQLNIGNNKGTETSKQISYSVWVDQDDLEMLSKLMEQGVDVSLQSVPRERNIDMKSILHMVAI
ncbi:MAG TPA: PTS sugar transporter subunit IIB [Deltaproteobacteria bacterium]|nr:PTS sugar transporter subunit IIB [Deltaproteobacteria bacterium]HPJ92311.1 PTS sugar transporter subunit IIB [Deltaproteobacteria bacterium]HPR52334.1 PTS sugar transporter subunit IIB [Deltaproteobacteria bacterium]